MPQYPVPQFIEEEGKIIFFLTFRQFFLLVGGGVICFLMFTFLPFWVFVVGSIFVVFIVVIIAFVKINGISVVRILLNYLGFLTQDKDYVWKKKDN